MALPAWVAELGIAAQVVIAVAAIYGEKIRARLSRPRLQIKLLEGVGDLEPRQLPGGGSIATVRYHRLHIRNGARHSVANEVQVFITKIERLEPTGNRRVTFTGAVPLAWQHQALYSHARNVGYSTVASVDLLYLSAEFIHLTPIVEPAPISLGDTMRGPQHFWITVVARGLNAASAPVRLEVQWDGEWHTADADLSKHFSISLS